MGTFNVETYLDVANGEHGEIVDVVLDEREIAYSKMSARVKLQFLLAYVPVKLNHTKAARLKKLEKGVILIMLMQK